MKITETLFAAAISSVLSLTASATFASASGGCPFGYTEGVKPERNLRERQLSPPEGETKALPEVADYEAVKKDIVALLTDSKDWWPADFGNYGPFFIRLAWHCSGTYRLSDGRGGCDGARIRHLPERAWEDNTNMDKALKLLEPLKLKYGASLSWGDLIALTGTTAIESMGGPKIGFCGGRVDDVDGSESLELDAANSGAQVECEGGDGKCKDPLGSTTSGLIYVNPQGPMGKPDPAGSAIEVRDTFKRMGFGDRETVALLGGGHGFGKMHGACATGPGPNPIEAPNAPWPGTCTNVTAHPKGAGNNTYTSGFEHAWAFNPTNWTNEYFKGLKNVPLFEQEVTPGGRIQWRGVPDTDPPLRMLTADLALINDDNYKPVAHEFADNITALADTFGPAWYKLLTLDMGPVTRCRGNLVPPAQPFQNPLPPAPAPSQLPDFTAVWKRVKALLHQEVEGLTSDTVTGGKTYNGALFVHLAYQCASTFRITDYSGGCNGAKIRFAPQKDWEGNAGLDDVLAALETIRKEFPTLSIADLIVLAGQVALQQGGSGAIRFVGGRVDALDGANIEKLAPRTNYKSPLAFVRDDAKVRGLTADEYVALAGRPRSLVQQKRLGYSGTFTDQIDTVSNTFFKVLVENTWVKSGTRQYKAEGKENVYVLETDVALLTDATYKSIVEKFAADEALFKSVFTKAWGTLMSADHFSTKEGYY
jgi:catalase-peroxidase